jgi:sarcosine oxidase, subunit gamma
MNPLSLQLMNGRAQAGCRGPNAAGWLAGLGLEVPVVPNSFSLVSDSPQELVIARLGFSEFFLEQGAAGDAVRRVTLTMAGSPPGVYPVLREDCGWLLSGTEAEAMLAEVCNVNFAALDLSARPVIMTLMIGVAVLVLPQANPGQRQYRIWCDPTYGPSLGETLQGVVMECGGTYLGVTA